MKQILLLFAIFSLSTFTSCSTTQENFFPKSDYTNANVPKLPETPEMKAFKESLNQVSRQSMISQKNGKNDSMFKAADQEYIVSTSKSLLLTAGYSQKEIEIDSEELFRLALKEYVKQSQNHKTY